MNYANIGTIPEVSKDLNIKLQICIQYAHTVPKLHAMTVTL